MRSTITIVRAVGAEFIRRTLHPLIVIGVAISIALLALGGWLITVSVWWWLLEVIFISGSLLFVLLVLLSKFILRRIESPLTKQQRQLIVAFVDKLERSVESLRTPYPVILFYVIRDLIRPKPNAFITQVVQDSKTLGPDFAKLHTELSATSR